MPEIAIGRSDALRLLAYVVENDLPWYVNKGTDYAFVGADGPYKFYFRGCCPERDNFADHVTPKVFGNDNFCEALPREWLEQFVVDPTIVYMVVEVEQGRLRMYVEHA